MVAEAPLQTTARGAAFEMNGVSVTPLASYEIRALVLGVEAYRFDEGAAVAPLDVAVGWGPMSDSGVLNKLNISQGNRWYYFRSKSGEGMPLPVEVLSRHSANMHLIPANQEINTQLKRLRVGQVATLKGRLVNVARADGWRWSSSLSRDDAGGGSCELMYVEMVETP